MKELSRIHSLVQASTTLAVDARYKQMKAEGIPVVGFGAGEPDFDTPQHIKQAAIDAINRGETKYTPSDGIVPLKKAISGFLAREFGVDYSWDSIVVSSGAKHCLYLTWYTILNPGDEVIVPTPFWVSYAEQLRMVGGVPVTVYTDEAQRFKITPEQLESAITDKTKALLLNNPCNPTGMVYTREELEALCRVCVKHDLYIVSDEVYYCLCYDGVEFTSVAALGEEIRERCILINAVSKAYAMTGWRCGFVACCNKAMAKIMSNCVSHSTGGIGTMNQYAMLEALTGPQDSVEIQRKVFQERRDYLVSRIDAMDGVSCVKPDGAFYVMMSIEKLVGKTLGGYEIRDADDFSMAFLEKGLVAVVSCCGFGAPNYVRWTYATSMENIKEGMDRLEKFLAG